MAQKKTGQDTGKKPAANDTSRSAQASASQGGAAAEGQSDTQSSPQSAGAAESAPDTPWAKDPITHVAALEEEIESLKDQLLRAVAETENVRKRSRKQLEDMAKYASTDFAKDMLGVGDNLRRALDSVPKDALEKDEHLKNLAKGVELTEKGLITVIERHGIKQINPLGEKFDPNLHQAMFQVDDANQPPGTVAQVVQSGYMIHDRLLRPAMVGVVKPREDASASAPQDKPADAAPKPSGGAAEAEPGAE